MTSETRVADELECQRLSLDFAQHIDAHEFDRVLELFTEDGVFIRRGTAFSGRPAIRQYLQSRTGDEVIRHLCTNSPSPLRVPD
jgi:ketosteroid isomerase-like protein